MIGGVQQAGNQRAGGGFAVAAGHGHRVLAGDQGGQYIGAMGDLQPRPAGCLQFRVRGGHRGAHHHQRLGGGAAADRGDGGGALFAEHPHAAAAQVLQHSVVARVGSTHLIAPIRQDSGDGRHADAADSNEMEGLTAIELLGQGHLQALGDGKPGRFPCLPGSVCLRGISESRSRR